MTGAARCAATKACSRSHEPVRPAAEDGCNPEKVRGQTIRSRADPGCRTWLCTCAQGGEVRALCAVARARRHSSTPPDAARRRRYAQYDAPLEKQRKSHGDDPFTEEHDALEAQVDSLMQVCECTLRACGVHTCVCAPQSANSRGAAVLHDVAGGRRSRRPPRVTMHRSTRQQAGPHRQRTGKRLPLVERCPPPRAPRSK